MTSLVEPWPLPAGDAPLARALARLDAAEDDVHAWVSVDRDAAGGDGPLAGVLVGVKDIIDVAGVPTRCGSATRRDAPPAAADADIVARLRALGAAPLGKTVTTEFAYFEPGPSRNPHDPRRTPGGSSSGSAAAVAAGMVPLALGTQTAGSTVRPAAFCGVAGYAVPRSVLPIAGVNPLAPSLDTIGLFTADVASMAIVRAALDGVTPSELPPTVRLLAWDGGAAPVASMRRAWSEAVARVHDAGATVGVPPPVDVAALAADHRLVLAHEAARTLPADSRASPLLGARTAELVAEGETVDDATHRDVLARAGEIRATVLDLLGEGTAILAPAANGPATFGLASTGDPSLNAPWHLLGLPALAVPGFRDEDGMPLGLALLGHPDREHELLALGTWLEGLIGSAAGQRP